MPCGVSSPKGNANDHCGLGRYAFHRGDADAGNEKPPNENEARCPQCRTWYVQNEPRYFWKEGDQPKQNCSVESDPAGSYAGKFQQRDIASSVTFFL